MAYSLDLTAVRTVIREKIGTVWEIPADRYIPEVGEEPIDNANRFPMALMEVPDEVSITTGQPAVNDVTQELIYRIWYLFMPSRNEDVLETLDNKTRDLALAFLNDRKLGGYASNLKLTARNWTGNGPKPPIDRLQGSAASGYITIEVSISESKY